MSFACQFCNNILKTKSALYSHQKTAKYCLKLRGENTTYNCSYCNKNLCQKASLDLHITSCKNKKLLDEADKKSEIEAKFQHIIDEYEAKLQAQKEDYEAKMIIFENIINKQLEASTELAKKIIETPNIVTKINCDNKYKIDAPLVLDDDHIKKVCYEKLTRSDCFLGQVGIARFIAREFLLDDNGKPTYMCTDASRGHFVFKDTNGQFQKDIGASHLTNKVHKPIVIASHRVCNKPIKDAEIEEEKLKCVEDDDISLAETETEHKTLSELEQEFFNKYLTKPLEQIREINNKEKNTAFKAVIAEEMHRTILNSNEKSNS